MATRFELVLEGRDAVRMRALAEEVFEEIQLCEESWSLFLPGSLLAKVNREAASRPVDLDPLTFELLREALEVARLSGGYFDPTLAPLMERFGFRSEDRTSDAMSWGADAVLLDEEAQTVAFTKSGLALDLGAIAKGRALDLAADILRERGVQNALLHGGTSSVVALGTPPDEEAWRVALTPEDDAPCALLRDQALSVSANRGRTNDSGGHVIDPLRGEPCRVHSTAAVIADSASLADAWATALCAAGERELELPGDLCALRRFDSDAVEARSTSWCALGAPTSSFQSSESPLAL